jgi:hypothetical protein
MYVLDPNNCWRELEKALESETDPAHRRNLENVINHGKYEFEGKFDELVDSMSDNVTYKITGFVPPGMEEAPRGKAAVKSFYQNLFASGLVSAEAATDVIVVNAGYVVTAGPFRLALTGEALQRRGIAVDDPQGIYLYESDLCTIWPFDDQGKMLGEHLYNGSDGLDGIADRKIDLGQIAPLEL